MSKKALLMILDGWGIGDQGKDDVIFNTPTPYWDSLLATYPHSQLQASGENVGLPDGQMGNSEVGHLNIGAGRIVYQDLVKINRACADNSIMKNPEIVSAFSYAKEQLKDPNLNIRIVSMPCQELFREQSEEYKESILPSCVENRIIVEAGSRLSWGEFAGFKGKYVTMDTFGSSGKPADLFKKFHLTVEDVIKAIKEF